MAAYNGGQYLSEQIKSVLGQSCKAWQLIIRDDGSTDNSLDVINEYIRLYPENIRLITDRDGRIGTSQNFLRLLGYADTDYIMFCDQDDVWLPDKIAITLNKMKACEEIRGRNIPVLIHTDLKVVDKHLDIISDSLWQYQHLDPKKGLHLNRLLVQNVITGCTVMINKALKDKIKSVPQHALIYDWWISLVAAALGTIDYVPTATALYRQHDNNEIGAKAWNSQYLIKTAKLGRSHLKSMLFKTQIQAKVFLNLFKNELSDDHIHLLRTFSSLEQQPFFTKRFNLIKYNLLKTGFLRNLGLFLAV
jgi:glycosyltransferase involved in cell wall biosynthesis